MMKELFLKKPYSPLIWAVPILLLLSVFHWHQREDLHFHDTYFVIMVKHAYWLLAILVFIAWILYILIEEILWTPVLTWVHVLATIVFLAIMLTANLWYDKFIPKQSDPRSYLDGMDQDRKNGLILLPIAMLFVLGQLSFFINLFGGVAKRIIKGPKLRSANGAP